ncbi:MAG: ATP-binding protein [Candidatus Levyibacteriota bacterium]
MFHSARIKLTVWYLLIIMIISISFSISMYRVLTLELDRVQKAQELRIQRRLPDRFRIPPPSDDNSDFQSLLSLDPQIIAETKYRLTVALALINFVILVTSAIAGYFLAGRTLGPIKEMMDEQNLFISDASHELRTPLTSLKSEIEVNLRDKNLTLGQAKKLLKSNLEEVNNLQVLSDGLIKINQYQNVADGFKFSEVSLLLIINDAIKKVASLAKSKNIKIINKIDDYLINGDRKKLTEVFVIFLDNAIKYSSQQTKVILSSKKSDGNIVVDISDEGYGISETDIPHLFDRFYRVDKSRTKTTIPGYGLGLSIAKKIINNHHGMVSVKSKIGKGSTFSIQLPLV